MKLSLAFLIGSIACLIAARLFGQSSGPVTVELVAPASGAVVSNTFTLTATASSTVAPIQRIEFFVDGILIGTKTVLPRTPTGLQLIQ